MEYELKEKMEQFKKLKLYKIQIEQVFAQVWDGKQILIESKGSGAIETVLAYDASQAISKAVEESWYLSKSHDDCIYFISSVLPLEEVTIKPHQYDDSIKTN